MTPKPAEAQTVIRACVANQGGFVLRSRFTYTDWQGTRHTSGWATLALGQRNCGTLQDLGSLIIEVQAWDLNGWTAACTRQVPDPKRNATMFLSGTSFDARCTLEQ